MERNPSDDRIACPKCGASFELTEVLTGRIRDHLSRELKAEAEENLKRERVRIEASVGAALAEKYEVELKDTRAALETSRKAATEAQQQELKLRQQARDLEEKQARLELDIARRMDEEREKIRLDAAEKASESHRLKDRERDKTIEDLRKALADAQRKAEQGSMETQGEVLEVDLEQVLRSAFPVDALEPVPKGIRGADLVQRVRAPDGHEAGIILWETKNTKAWSNQWTQKLKDDQLTVRADVSVLVSVALPPDVDRFGYQDGIWISDRTSAIGLATALRQHLVALAFERRASIGKNEKMEALYGYLSGPEFRQKIEAIVETFSAMKGQIDRERRAMEKNWKEREKQIQRVVLNTSGMYGDIGGIAGASIPSINALELDDTTPQLPDTGTESA